MSPPPPQATSLEIMQDLLTKACGLVRLNVSENEISRHISNKYSLFFGCSLRNGSRGMLLRPRKEEMEGMEGVRRQEEAKSETLLGYESTSYWVLVFVVLSGVKLWGTWEVSREGGGVRNLLRCGVRSCHYASVGFVCCELLCWLHSSVLFALSFSPSPFALTHPHPHTQTLSLLLSDCPQRVR